MEEVKNDETTKKQKKPRSEAQVAAFQKGLVALKARRDAIKKEKEEKIKQISVPVELPPQVAPVAAVPPVPFLPQQQGPVAAPPPQQQGPPPVKKERKPYSPRVVQSKDQITRSDFDNFKTDLYGIMSSKQSTAAQQQPQQQQQQQQPQQIIIKEKLISGSELLDKIFFN
jgi:hypothetical protein